MVAERGRLQHPAPPAFGVERGDEQEPGRRVEPSIRLGGEQAAEDEEWPVTSLEELQNLLGEPRFLWSDPTPWNDLEQNLGVPLPRELREFSDAYGAILINNQLDIGHPGVTNGNLGVTIQRTIEAWSRAPEDEVPYAVGTEPGSLLPWAGTSSGETLFFRIPEDVSSVWPIGVYESNEGGYLEYTLSFNEWMLAYLRGEDVTVCSKSFAPDGPFYEPTM
ncbi:SMI1/KNR4 family protein [Streptomyces sp. NPDC002671]